MRRRLTYHVFTVAYLDSMSEYAASGSDVQDIPDLRHNCNPVDQIRLDAISCQQIVLCSIMKSILTIVFALPGLVAATTSASPSAASTCLCPPVRYPTATNAWYNCPNKICGAAQEREFSNQRCGGTCGDCPAVFIAGNLTRACCNNGYCGLQGNFAGTCDAADTCIQDCLYSSGTPPASGFHVSSRNVRMYRYDAADHDC